MSEQTAVGAQQDAGTVQKRDFVETDLDAIKPKETEAPSVKKEEAKVEVKAESEEDETDTQDEDGNEENEGKPKKKGGWQRKLDSAKREAEYWKGLASQQVKVETKTEEPKQLAEPKLSDYEDYDEYQKAVLTYNTQSAVDKVFKEREAKEKEAQLRQEMVKRQEAFSTQKEEARKIYDDFDEVIESYDKPLNPYVSEALLDSPLGAEIAYYLAKNPDIADKVIAMSPTSMQREIGKIEAVIELRKGEGKEVTEKKVEVQKSSESEPVAKVSKAPPPIKTVNSSKAEPNFNPETASFEEYRRWRAKTKTR